MDGCEIVPLPARLVSSGVDWLTATAYRSSDNERFDALGKELVERQAALGHEVKTHKAGGYHGLQTEGVSRGVRHDTFIIRLSSDVAHDSWREVAALATNISRCDVEVTFEFDAPVKDFITRNQALALSHVGARGRRRNVTLIQSTTQGDSLYLGKRTSDIYARVYDKGREQKIAPAGTLFRQEVEYKSERAAQVVTHLTEAACELTETTALVCSYMRSAGLETTWYDGKRAMAARESHRSKHQKLRWLEQAAKPSVVRLCEAGRVREVIEALGLAAYVTTLAGGLLEDSAEED